MNIYAEYSRILNLENQMKYKSDLNIPRLTSTIIHTPTYEISQQIYQLVEIAKNSLVPRSYIKNYGLSDVSDYYVTINGKKMPIVHESVAAHTNLFTALVDRALTFTYGFDFGEAEGEFSRTSDGYSYREIMEAIRLHDLPENDIGDIPDNGEHDQSEKDKLELEYYSNKIYNRYPGKDIYFSHRVFRLLDSMQNLKSDTGRMLYVADKTAAVFMTLVYDSLGLMPLFDSEKEGIGKRDKTEISLCDFEYNGNYKASEMWAVDFFHIRKINELDSTSFFIAIIILYTLIVNGHWYDWREDDYRRVLG